MTINISSLLSSFLMRQSEEKPAEQKNLAASAAVSDTYKQSPGKNLALRTPAALALGIFAAGCSSGPSNLGSSILPPAGEGEGEGRGEGEGVGEGEGPVTKDAGADAAPDAGHDAGHDASVDAARDTGEGEGEGPVVTDAGEEAGRDAGADAAGDVGVDAAPDVAEGEGEDVGPPPVDTDRDGRPDDADNCPLVPNPFQENRVSPNDAEGDACDDSDQDGVLDAEDNCPINANPDQANNATPATRPGDVCEDNDGDGIMDARDNCPQVFNRGQENFVNPATREGDHCEDSDNDDVPDFIDNCPFTLNDDQTDTNNDGVGDACSDDLDGDGVLNEDDNCEDVPNPNQEDTSAPIGAQAPNGIGDHCEDSDDDGVNDINDRCPLGPGHADADADQVCDAPEGPDNCNGVGNADQRDTDGDNIGNACDDDDDGDGLSDAREAELGTNPLLRNTDGDPVEDGADPFPTDPAEWEDTDGDRVGNNADICPLNADPDQSDIDGDDIGDVCDDDADGDGLTNDQETQNPDPSRRTNPFNRDTDGDTFSDAEDSFPLDVNEWSDADNDGTGDNGDNCPVTPNPGQENRDADSAGDACDHDPQTGGIVASGVDENGNQFLTVLCTDEDNDLVRASANVVEGVDVVASGVSAFVPGPEVTVAISPADLPAFANLCWAPLQCEDTTGNATPFAEEDPPCFDTLDPSLVHGWNFQTIDQNQVSDISGFDKEGEVRGPQGGLPALVAGVRGNAVGCDGTDDYIQTADPVSVGIADSWTISLWLNFNNFNNIQSIVTIGNRGDLAENGNFRNYLELIATTTGDQKVVFNHIGNNGTSNGVSSANAVFTAGEWQHVALTYDGNDLVLYRNGVPQAWGAEPNLAAQISTDRYISLCRELDRDRRYVNGAVDEFFIYDRALGADEVQEACLRDAPNGVLCGE